MILKSLYDYYTRHEDQFPPYGWAVSRPAYRLSLTAEGKFESFSNVDAVMNLPNNGDIDIANTSGIAPAYYHGTSKYVLGGDVVKKVFVRISKCDKKLQAFIDLHEGIKDSGTEAVVKFLKRWKDNKEPDAEREISEVMAMKGTAGGAIIISVGGKLLHERQSLINYWNKVVSDYKAVEGTCLVTGKKGAIRKIHGKIRGVPGANASGATLVSFNQTAHQSYGVKTTHLAPIGCKVEFGYRSALCSFLSGPDNHCYMGGKTIAVFWTGHKKHNLFCRIFGRFLGIKEDEGQGETETLIRSALESMKKGKVPDRLPEDEPFSFALLSGNNGRIYVREFLQGTIGSLVENVHRHCSDIEMEGTRIPSLQALAWATIPDKARNRKPASPIYRALVDAILRGMPYDNGTMMVMLRLCQTPGNRVATRTAFLKAYLNRKYRLQNREEIPMSLDKSRDNIGYLLGRMLCVADRIQEKSFGRKPNKSFSDTSLRSLGTVPRNIFKTLDYKVHMHLAKIRRSSPGLACYFESQYNEIVSKIVNVPAVLTLDEQTEFCIGFRHQIANGMTKTENKSTKKEEVSNG